METPSKLKYTKSHEWILKTGDTVKIGITDFAQDALGDLVFINLPEVGDEVECETAFADVESVKAVSDIFSPVTGIVLAVNTDLLDAPEAINAEPYDAWMIEVKDVSETVETLSAEEYDSFCETEEH